MADRTAPPVIKIGQVRGVDIIMARSRKSRFARIKEKFGGGEHITLSTKAELKWSDRPDVSGEHLLAHFTDMKRENLKFMTEAFWEIFPEYDGIPLSLFGFQTTSNDAISGGAGHYPRPRRFCTR